MPAAVNSKGLELRFDVEVHWNPNGLLEGEVRPVGEAAATQFWGIAELVGLLQAQLGPARPGGSPASPAGLTGHGTLGNDPAPLARPA
jgi:hypothetical protein